MWSKLSTAIVSLVIFSALLVFSISVGSLTGMVIAAFFVLGYVHFIVEALVATTIVKFVL